MDGPDGCKGDKGIKGIKGVPGPQGLLGNNGPLGDRGEDGHDLMSPSELTNRVVKIIADEIIILQSNINIDRTAEVTPLRNKMRVPIRYDTRFQKKNSSEQCSDTMDAMMNTCDLE